MTAEIKSIFGGVVPGQDSVPDIIKILEETLEKARMGEVRSLALVWIDVGDGVHRNWNQGDKFNSQLLGSIADLQYQFLKAWDQV